MMKEGLLGAGIGLTLYASSSLALSIGDVAQQPLTLTGKEHLAPNRNLPSLVRNMKDAD